MNLAVPRITTGSADDNNSVRIFSWLIFRVSWIILEQVLYNKFLSFVKYVHLHRKCVSFSISWESQCSHVSIIFYN